MDIERAIEFLIKNQARMDARFDARFDRADERFHQVEQRFRQAEARFDRLERAVRLNNRVVTRLVRYGVSLRSDVRRLTQAQAGTDRALRTFIQAMRQGNGGSPRSKGNGMGQR
jgi:hypothetical protein